MVRTLWRFRWLLRPYRLSLAVGSVLVILVAATSVAAPWPLKIIVDNVIKRKHPSPGLSAFLGSAATGPEILLRAALAALVAIVVIGAVSDYFSNAILDGIGERVSSGLRERLFEHLEYLSISYHQGQRVGDLTMRLTSDVDHVQEMLLGILSVLFPNVLILGGMVVIMFVADPIFASVSLAITPLLLLSASNYTRRIKRASKTARRKEGDVASLASETFSSIRLVQAYTNERRHLSWFRDRNRERLVAGLQVIDLQAQLSPLIDVIATIGTVLALWVGVHRVETKQITLGLLLVFVAYISKLYQPMRNLSKLSIILNRGQASAERLTDILSVDSRVPDAPDALVAPRFAGEVRLVGVTFGYEPGKPVLDGVSLTAAPGELIALTGLTGAGKSTLTSLIGRFYDPWEGQVLIDGQDVRTFTLASLRRQVSVVLQESVLFHGTILENIAYGCDGAAMDRVLEAARAAHVEEFVRRLPDGYDTIVSERGTTLSGGQRQRIAIARALMRDAPIVILDEPTSELDALSERHVMKGLERLVAGRTVIVIAHRLATLRKATRIFVLNRGRIVASGTHDDLVSKPGLYRGLVAAHDESDRPRGTVEAKGSGPWQDFNRWDLGPVSTAPNGAAEALAATTGARVVDLRDEGRVPEPAVSAEGAVDETADRNR
jgi:subfamily B ATP-binding cassette protein MsbA